MKRLVERVVLGALMSLGAALAARRLKKAARRSRPGRGRAG
jgi:hypothetical protein